MAVFCVVHVVSTMNGGNTDAGCCRGGEQRSDEKLPVGLAKVCSLQRTPQDNSWVYKRIPIGLWRRGGGARTVSAI